VRALSWAREEFTEGDWTAIIIPRFTAAVIDPYAKAFRKKWALSNCRLVDLFRYLDGTAATPPSSVTKPYRSAGPAQIFRERPAERSDDREGPSGEPRAMQGRVQGRADPQRLRPRPAATASPPPAKR
jgi:hypothetical protein